MNRCNIMIWLAILTAITLIGQYIMLGNTGIGQSRTSLPSWFWVLEQSLWGLRALVEVGVVIYIGMTVTEDKAQIQTLWLFRALLIGLIIITVGPVWGAYSLEETILEILGRGGVIVWGLTLAGISATMLAGVSYAYRVQPFDIEVGQEFDNLQQSYNGLSIKFDNLSTDYRILSNDNQQLLATQQGFATALQFFKLLPQTAIVEMLARFNDGQLDAREIAEVTGTKITTVRAALSKMEK